MGRSGDTVECCVHNVDMETWRCLSGSDVEFEQQHCLQRCGVCHEGPFFVRNGDLIRVESYDALLRSLEVEGVGP